MSTQTTAPSAAEAQRRGHMAAQIVAEHLLSISPVPPYSVQVSCSLPPTGVEVAQPRVRLHFSPDTDGVEQLAALLDEETKAAENSDDDPRTYLSVDAIVDNIPVHAWSLLPLAQDSEVPA